MPQLSYGEAVLLKILSERREGDFLRLREEWLDSPRSRQWFTFIGTFYRQYGALPVIDTFREEAGVRDTVPTDAFGYYHDRFLQRVRLRLLEERLPAISSAVESSNLEDAARSLREISELLTNVEATTQRELMSMSEVGREMLAELRSARILDGVTGIPTPWPTLTRTTRGLQRGDLYVVLARVKMGKTMILIEMANAAHRSGRIPLVISMEMRKNQIAKRHFARRAGMNMEMMNQARISYLGEERLIAAIEEMEREHPYYLIEGQFRKDIQDIRALVSNLRPDVLFIDGGYLVKMSRSTGRARWEVMGDIAQEMKNIATVANIPMVVSFQFNREVKKGAKTAGFENAQLTDAIGQLASVGIGLFEDQDPNSYTARERRYIEVVGGREGETGGFKIRWDWQNMLFDEIPNENVPEAENEDFGSEGEE